MGKSLEVLRTIKKRKLEYFGVVKQNTQKNDVLRLILIRINLKLRNLGLERRDIMKSRDIIE